MIHSSRRLSGFVVSFVTAMLVAWTTPSIAAKPREITVKEAKALLRSALPRETVRVPGFYIEGGKDPDQPRFYWFEVTWRGWMKSSDEPGSNLVGHYEVDRKTGDVWDSVICQEETSPRLDVLKKKIRRTIGLSEADYKKLRIQGSMCQE